MKVTRAQLKQIIKEELSKLNEAMDFNERKIQVARIHDGFVDFLEAEKKFPMGQIPRSVLDAIMKTALTVVDSMEAEAQLSEATYYPGKAVGQFSDRDADNAVNAAINQIRELIEDAYEAAERDPSHQNKGEGQAMANLVHFVDQLYQMYGSGQFEG